MNGRFSHNPFVNEQDALENSPENSSDSPRSSALGHDTKMPSTSSPKKRRAAQKKVVSVPIGEMEGSRLKGESTPPSDSWAWRKYGQKPIKGSPYPRGYYRCSSSKGCPARKQVERSCVDPTMLVVTYSSEHNHPLPTLKNNNHNHHRSNHQLTTTTLTAATPEVTSVSVAISNSNDEKQVVFDLGEDSLLSTYEFKWFSDLESTSTTLLESPIIDGADTDRAMIFSMREEDESLFADLGELPECSVVFQRRGALEERRPCDLASWLGTTG